jgi:hypothetical protein
MAEYSIPIATYTFESFDRERGAEMKRQGVHGEGRLIAWEPDESVIVVAWKEYGENPGSRYSGLYSYYPATTEVFVFEREDKFGRKRYRSLTEWNTRPEKRKGE